MKEVCPCAPGHTAREWLGQNQSSELRSVQPQGQARHAAWQSAQRIRRTKPLPPSPSVVLRVLKWHIQTRPKVLKAICWWIKGSRILTPGRSWQHLVPIFIKTAQNTLAFQAMLRYGNQWDWCHPRWGPSRGSFSSNSGAHWEPWKRKVQKSECCTCFGDSMHWTMRGLQGAGEDLREWCPCTGQELKWWERLCPLTHGYSLSPPKKEIWDFGIFPHEKWISWSFRAHLFHDPLRRMGADS